MNTCSDDTTSEHESEVESVTESVQNEPELEALSETGRRHPKRNSHEPNRWQSDRTYRGRNNCLIVDSS